MKSSASFSRSTSHTHCFSFPYSVSSSTIRIRTSPLGKSVLLPVFSLFLHSHVYPSIFYSDHSLPFSPVLFSVLFPFHFFLSSLSTSKLSHAAVVIIFVFFMLKYRPAFSLSLFTLLINSTRSFFFPANNVVSSAYLKLFSIFPASFTPSVVSSNPAFLIILSAYRLNRKGDKMQPCLTPFLTLNFPVSPYSVLNTAP